MPQDPLRLFDSKDLEAAALYAQRVGGTDFYPVKLDADGYLLTNLTVGTITAQLSSTASTITNAAGNPVPVNVVGPVDASGYVLINMTVGTISLSSTASTITNAAGNPVPVTGNINIATATLGTVTVTGTVTPSTTAATITNAVANPVNVALTSTEVTVKSAVAGFNVNVATATLGTVTTSLSSTLVTIQNTAGVVNVSVRSATLGTVAVSGTVTLSQTAATISNAVGNPVNVLPTTTGVTVSIGRVLTGTTISFSATTSTVTTAGTNRQKIYAISVTTTATTSSVISFVNGTYGGMVLWKAVLQAPSGANAGLNLAVTPPAFLFATASATLLRMNLSAAIPVEVSLSYFDEA